MQVFDQINTDGWSSRSALEACIGDQAADADHPIMDAQLAAQKGDEQTGEGEVRRSALPASLPPGLAGREGVGRGGLFAPPCG